ncbi:MAG TPA: VOC family protein [Clostridia bacterium]|nr:VOC family protein [Clostridia bacterium]
MKLNWVTIRVGDLEKSLFFYTQLLKLEVAARFPSGEREIVMLGDANEAKIELIYEAGKSVETPGRGVTIGLEADDLDALVHLLKENGLALTGPISPNPKLRFFFVKDPDGYSVQLAEHKE